MSQTKSGDTIRINYTGGFPDGTTFDSSEGREPLELQLGSGQIIPGLDQALHGMEVGEKKQVSIAPAQGYGERDETRMIQVPRAQLPQDIPTEPGTQLAMQGPDGQPVPVMIAAADEENVTLDANHPLAGRDLVFDVEIVEIKNAA
ncbi:peptidylprolyl isomerase [Parvularcula sp. ZS-1/3]|uniref:Peptidyl-prolyl cis-trans isomerase n=1 Tax=Parvularcula mediterranea TaxID=2732508 RepID=A0A7Y3RJT8_9PROT|nr:peptidylprolyl isomerase [Parvularcula mediterranea]NNU14970.1 peptidylprolyl isomerase [Parvularcula mediterranea]